MLTIPVLFAAASVGGCGATTMHDHTATSRSSPSSTRRGTTPATPTTTTTSRPDQNTLLLHGMVVTIDPGHNGGNFSDPGLIGKMIWNGRASETCDTTGTETDGGYSEALFNFDVAQYLSADLEAEGASVVLTRTTNTGVGPCVTERAAIGNDAHSAAAVSIHADGGPAGGRGFAVLEPVADGVNDSVIAPSQVLGADLRNQMVAQTDMPISTYDGSDGVAPRDDLAGLNLSRVPKVLIECGNMRNATDAALLVSPTWQQQAAHAIAAGLTMFLATRATKAPRA